MPTYTTGQNLYKWNKTDTKLETITETAANADKIDAKLTQHDVDIETANTNASDAVTAATNAGTTANQAKTDSSAALTNANSALEKANNADLKADEALSNSESTQNQLDTIIIESGTSDAEVLQARGGFQVLNDRMNNTDAQLAQIMYHYSSLGLKGDGTDTSSAFQSALETLRGKNATLNLSDATFSLDGNITLPPQINLTGRKAKINFSANIEFEGSQKIERIHFDGGNSCGELIIRNNDVDFCFNKITNIKGSVDFTCALRVRKVDSTDIFNVSIYENTFDGIIAWDSNGIQGDNIGMARAIMAHNPHNIRIYNNIFKNMVGTEDGDYIQLLSNYDNVQRFPFNSNGRTKNIEGLISNNEFYLKAKSGIKLSASGCVVENNRFYIESGTGTLAAIRGHSIGDTTIKGNTIFISGNNGSMPIYFDFVENTMIIDNTLICKETTVIGAEYGGIHVAEALHITIKNNKGFLYNRQYAISLRNVKKVSTENNTFKMYYTTEDTRTVMYPLRGLSESSSTYVNGLVFKGNTVEVITSDGRTLDCFLNMFSFTNTNIEKLTINGDVLKTKFNINYQSAKVIIDGIVSDKPVHVYVEELSADTTKFVDDVTIHNGRCDKFLARRANNVKITNVYGVENQSQPIEIVYGNNIRIENSIFNGVYDYFIRVYNSTDVSNIQCINNNLKDAPSLFNLYNNTINHSELHYVKGAIPLPSIDYGTSTLRPDFSLQKNHFYFDETLNKPIWWNGSVWKDATGVTV